jgi:drug/metabolite transporter (DMT)-like permease
VGVERPATDRIALASEPTRADRPDRILWAIAIYVAAFMIFPLNDALAKRLAVRYPIAEIGAIRNGVHFLIVCGVACFWQRAGTLRTARPGLHLLRGAIMAGTTLCLFGALRTVSLANVTTLLFVAPLLVVALSGPVLGERIRLVQWLAVGAGFVGVALVFRPAIEEFDWGMPLALGAAVCGALHQLVSRELSRTDRPLVGLFYVTLVGTGVLGTLALLDWRTPSIEDCAVMAAMGLIAAAGYFAVFKAIELASPARLAPFYYLQIITAVALGYGMFGDIPDAWTVLGLAVIVGAGLICLGLERARRRSPVARTR